MASLELLTIVSASVVIASVCVRQILSTLAALPCGRRGGRR